MINWRQLNIYKKFEYQLDSKCDINLMSYHHSKITYNMSKQSSKGFVSRAYDWQNVQQVTWSCEICVEFDTNSSGFK